MAASCSKSATVCSETGDIVEKSSEVSGPVVSTFAPLKRPKQSWSRSGCKPELDPALWSTMDEYLLEKIIAKLPFKSLFQASSLSKIWASKFSLRSFQNEVLRATSTWKTYSPLFVNNYMEMIGYDSAAKLWHSLPSLSYLPADAVEWNLRAGGGSLLCWTAVDQKMPLEDSDNNFRMCNWAYNVYISNPLIRQWKQLPPRPRMLFPQVVHVVCQGSNAYQVILVSEKGGPGSPECSLCIQIFGSSSGIWTENHHTTGKFLDVGWNCSAYVNGVVHMLGRRDGYSLTSFNVQDGTWSQIPHFWHVDGNDKALLLNRKRLLRFHEVRFSQVVVCGSDVMLVVLHKDKLAVFRLDLEDGVAVEVSRAPSEMLWAVHFCAAAGQGDCIYVGRRCPSFRSILYNTKAQEWHWVPTISGKRRVVADSRYDYWLWTSITYDPGLNPFLAV